MTVFKPFALLLFLFASLHLPSAVAARSLVVWVYPHDELADISDEQLNKDYFQHWLDEMRQFTSQPIEIIFQRNVHGITDISYSGMTSNEILDLFTQEITYRPEAQLFSFMKKHLLLTREPYDRSGLNYTAGLAFIEQTTAIASLAVYAAPAHELGHMLSATHEDAEVQFNGWFCETYTHPRVPLRSNCYRYSDKNRENITNYIKYNSN